MQERSTIAYILEHQKKYNERLYLVASENSPSINARLVFLTDILNRYYFPLASHRHWAFPGNELMEGIYERCRTLLGDLTGSRFVNIKPISGVSAMTVALAALGGPGDTIATISPENGGHIITSFIAKRLGLKVKYLPYDKDGFLMDIDALSDFITNGGVKLIYLDQANILFPHPLKEMRACIPESVKIYYDGSHVMGLIFGNNFQRPLEEGATFLGGSTHKTIPGPHKGFIATNDEAGFEAIDGCSKTFISHDHGADIAALTIILEEMHEKWPRYAAQVVKNSQRLAHELSRRGFVILAEDLGFTKSHQLWIDIGPLMEPFEAVKLLANHNIITNTIGNAPGLNGRLALRLGVQEVTYHGATEEIMDSIADIFEDIFIKKSTSETEIKKRVAAIKQHLRPRLDIEYAEKILKAIQAL